MSPNSPYDYDYWYKEQSEAEVIRLITIGWSIRHIHVVANARTGF